MVPLSILDLAPITQGSDAAEALRHSLDLARHAERWGYTRFWVAEHHNMPGIASAATAIVIAHVAQGTKTIRVGAGGIMLPNHAPLIVAEQFGTLESLFPGRIDLGLGRAPGTDQTTAMALRRTLASNPDLFPQDVLELMAYFQPEAGQRVRAVPGAGSDGADLHPGLEPVWRAGRGGVRAAVRVRVALRRAADDPRRADLPRALQAVGAAGSSVRDARGEHYRGRHRRRGAAARDIGTSVVREPARRQSHPAAAAGRRDGRRTWCPFDATQLETLQSISFVGSPETVTSGIGAFRERMRPDELIVVSHVYDHSARLRSYELAAMLGR